MFKRVFTIVLVLGLASSAFGYDDNIEGTIERVFIGNVSKQLGDACILFVRDPMANVAIVGDYEACSADRDLAGKLEGKHVFILRSAYEDEVQYLDEDGSYIEDEEIQNEILEAYRNIDPDFIYVRTSSLKEIIARIQ